MKKTITLLAAVFAFCVMAEPLNLQMPFKKGRKTPIAWWNGKATLVEADGVNAVALEKGKGITFKNAFPGKAGDKIVYEITFKRSAGSVSLRLGTWSKEGWIGEAPSYLKGGKDFSVAKGEIVLKDAAKPDSKGVLRKVSKFDIRLQAHNNSSGVVIRDIKIEVVPQK